jgi:hypothetical protein
LKARSFLIKLHGVDYMIDVIEDKENNNTEVFVDREDIDEGEDLPDNELAAVVKYLIAEGFVTGPDPIY